MQSRILIPLMILSFLMLSACSFKLGAKKAQEEKSSEVYFSQMVIDRSAFDRDLNKICKHTQECTAPLICHLGHCDIPPAITGNRDETTPVLKFKTATGEHQVFVEVVNDEYTMSRGLMMRRACLDNWGMVFVYPDQGKRAFWMHNTYISLDMVFIRADGSVSNVIERAEPLNDGPRYMSTDRVKYVLELPAGSVSRFGLKSGSQFDLAPLKAQ